MRTIVIYFILIISFVKGHSQDKQPFYHQTKLLIEQLDFLGTPLNVIHKDSIKLLIEQNADVGLIQKIVNKYTLFEVTINPESRVKVIPGYANPVLNQNGWKTFLIKVENQAGITAALKINSDQAKQNFDGGEKIYGMDYHNKGEKLSQQIIQDRWLDLEIKYPIASQSTLTGLETEYLFIQIYSRDKGKRAATFKFDCGQATQDIGFRNEATILFNALPASKVKLNIKDENGKPVMASLVIKDENNHIYPNQSKRLAPDFFFQQQIYRFDGEIIELAQGNYSIEFWRGPEYFKKKINFNVTDKTDQEVSIQLQRWINPANFGWFSGDHHIHAAGCSHYTSPTEGVNPEDMMRHLLGEAVNVGSVLTWGSGYNHQKYFFEGKDNKLSTKENLLRYDLEISGFPSSHAGHLVLLRLKDQYYPKTKSITDWPTYTLPILRWAKKQGAITGYAHSGMGLEVKSLELPNYEMPRFDGIGANEYIVAVTHNLVDFISTLDTPPTWELNIWYHTLNCGFRTRIAGETDFPCFSDDRIAYGRSYVKLKKLNYEDWTQGLKDGNSYVGEGKSHILDFSVNNVQVGTNNSELQLAKPSKVKITANVAAMLDDKADLSINPLTYENNIWDLKPFWNLERSRINGNRLVALELIVNGEAIEQKQLKADGSIQKIEFETEISKSSWIALRILYSSHSNPIFVIIDNKPIRANKKSAEWCLNAVDICWNQKKKQIKSDELYQAENEYKTAKDIYMKIIKESY